jgi:hypothetical protein
MKECGCGGDCNYKCDYYKNMPEIIDKGMSERFEKFDMCHQCEECKVENTAVLDCADSNCKCHTTTLKSHKSKRY